MQAPGCSLPYSNGIVVPVFYKNPLVADVLEKDQLEGWDELLQSIDQMALVKADHDESTISDQDPSENADAQGDEEMYDSSDEEAQ